MSADQPRAARLVADLPAHPRELIAQGIGSVEVLGLARLIALDQEPLLTSRSQRQTGATTPAHKRHRYKTQWSARGLAAGGLSVR